MLKRAIAAALGAGALVALAGCTPAAVETRCAAPAGDADDSLAPFAGACASRVAFSEGGTAWTIDTFRSGRPGPLFVVLHDDENAALATAAGAMTRHGGTVVAVETGGRRFAGRLDPNRNFHAGPLPCRGPRAERFVAEILAAGGRPVIALHTNARGSARTGGSGTIAIDAPYAGATAFPAAGADADAMVILASARGADDAGVRSLVAALNGRGINVMVETVDLSRTDCSLSHYALAAGLPYANVEARDGDAATLRAILDALLPLL